MPEAIPSAYSLLTMSVSLTGVALIVPDVNATAFAVKVPVNVGLAENTKFVLVVPVAPEAE